MEFRSTLLTTPSDVPTTPDDQHLKISGCSLIFYVAHRLTGIDMLDQFSAGALKVPSDDRSYESKVRPGSGLLYSTFIDSGSVPVACTRLLGSSHATGLTQSIITFGEDYALSAIPFLLSVPRGDDAPGIHLPGPINVDLVLRLISLLLDPEIAEVLARQAAVGLAEKLSTAESGIQRSWPIPGAFGIQIWNLDGTPERPSGKLYDGVAESIKYSWEISALLSYGTDHMLEEGLWRRRTPQHVFNHVRVGSAFFNDHMVFVNPDCCLEMGHLPAWTRDRSRYRLARYGYDSSSIYVWSIGVLRGAILADLTARYDSLVADLTTKDTVTLSQHAAIAKQRLRHEALLARMIHFRHWLVEARNRALDEEAFRDRADSRLIDTAASAMEKVRLLSQSLLQVGEEYSRSRRDILLASLAVGLAAVQIPQFIQQIHDWYVRKAWLLLGSSGGIICAVIAATAVVAYIYRRGQS